MTDKFEVGDKVRIVYEGTVQDINTYGELYVDGQFHDLGLGIAARVELLEKKKRKFRVGDVLKTVEDLEAVPVYAGIKFDRLKPLIQKLGDGAYWAADGKWDVQALLPGNPHRDPLRVVYLPESD